MNKEGLRKLIKEELSKRLNEILAKDDQGGRTNLNIIKKHIGKETFDKVINDYLKGKNINDLTLFQSYELLKIINDLQTELSDKPMWGKDVKTDINPYSMPHGKPGRDGYTGD